MTVGWPILLVGLGSVLAGWFYTAKPFALGYSRLGETEVFFFMGPVMVLGSFYVKAIERRDLNNFNPQLSLECRIEGGDPTFDLRRGYGEGC